MRPYSRPKVLVLIEVSLSGYSARILLWTIRRDILEALRINMPVSGWVQTDLTVPSPVWRPFSTADQSDQDRPDQTPQVHSDLHGRRM